MLGHSALSEFPVSAIGYVVVTATTPATPTPTGGGAPRRRSSEPARAPRRTIDYEAMWRHVDRVNAANRKERKDAFERIDRAIEEAVNGIAQEAKAIGVTPPPAPAATASVIRERISQALSAERFWKKPQEHDEDALRRQLEMFERYMEAARKSLEVYQRAIEEDDEDILLLMAE